MRIAHVSTKFSRLSETFIYDLVVAMEEAGHENHVLTAARVNTAQRQFDRVRVLTVPLWRQAAFAIQKNVMGVYAFPLPSRMTRLALQDVRPEVVLAHFGGTGAAVVPFTRALGLPLVVVFHAFDLFTRPFTPERYADLWGSLDTAVTVSNHGRERLVHGLGCPPEKAVVIHCGIDLSRFTTTGGDARAGKPLRLGTIGRLVEKKGTDDLLRALALARRSMDGGFVLDIWGNGPRRQPLERLARTLGLKQVVRFRGSLPSAEVPEMLLNYDAFALPSRTAGNGDAEGIPITILEAQAAGLPVLSTHHAGIPEAIPPENHHLLAREHDPADLAQKLVWLSQHRRDWSAIGARGLAWVAAHFSLQAEVHAYLQVLQRAASRSATTTAREA